MSKQGKKIMFDFAMSNDGRIALFARGDATAEDAKIALEMIMAALQTENIALDGISAVERHDDARIQQVHDLTHLHNHD